MTARDWGDDHDRTPRCTSSSTHRATATPPAELIAARRRARNTLDRARGCRKANNTTAVMIDAAGRTDLEGTTSTIAATERWIRDCTSALVTSLGGTTSKGGSSAASLPSPAAVAAGRDAGARGLRGTLEGIRAAAWGSGSSRLRNSGPSWCTSPRRVNCRRKVGSVTASTVRV